MGLFKRFDQFILATPTAGPYGLLAEFASPSELLQAARPAPFQSLATTVSYSP